MRRTPIVAGLVLSSIVFATAPAQAQVKVDATKITCGEFVAHPGKFVPLYVGRCLDKRLLSCQTQQPDS